jgi:hypothetical protein
MSGTPLPEPAALKKLRVADLKGLLESRGMDSTGKKAGAFTRSR